MIASPELLAQREAQRRLVNNQVRWVERLLEEAKQVEGSALIRLAYTHAIGAGRRWLKCHPSLMKADDVAQVRTIAAGSGRC